YDSLFAHLIEEFAATSCFSISNVPIHSPFWEHLNRSECIHKHFLVYPWRGICDSHKIELPGTFQAYMSQYRSRYRRTIKRQIRLLREFGAGKLVLQKVEKRNQVAEFLELVALMDRQNQDMVNLPRRHAEFLSLADRGLLLGYLLWCGRSPCASV